MVEDELLVDDEVVADAGFLRRRLAIVVADPDPDPAVVAAALDCGLVIRELVVVGLSAGSCFVVAAMLVLQLALVILTFVVLTGGWC